MSADFKTMLDEKKARWIAQAGAELSTQTEIKRWWPDVHEDSRFAAVNYLNSKTSVKNETETSKFYVTDPLVDGETLEGDWRLVYAGVEDGRRGVVQVLRKGFVTTLDDGGAVDWSEFRLLNAQAFMTERRVAVLRLENVAPAAAQDLVTFLDEDEFEDVVYRDDTLEGSWLKVRVSSDADSDGSYHVDVVLRNALLNGSYIVTGGRKTNLVKEESRLYQDIPESYITDFVTSLVALGDYALVDGAARKTSEPGLFDIQLTLRTLLVPPGGTDILISGTNGVFKTQVRMLRNVADANVEATVTAFLNTSLISDAKAVAGSEDGLWNIIYTKLLIPAPRIEYKAVQDFKELPTRYETGFWTEQGVYRYMLNGPVSSPSYAIMPCAYATDSGYSWQAGKQTRKIEVQQTISYSATRPTVNPTYGELTQLSNGIWQNIEEVTTHPWWNRTA